MASQGTKRVGLAVAAATRFQSDIDFMSRERKALESLELCVETPVDVEEFNELDMIEDNEDVDLGPLSELKNLKTLKIHSNGDCLGTLRSDSLEHLIYVRNIPVDCELVAINCPNLRQLEIQRP